MGRLGGASDTDAAALLCDVASLYTVDCLRDDVLPAGSGGHHHERLIASRALPVLAHMWTEAARALLDAHRGDSPAATAGGGALAPAAPAAIAAALHRVTAALATAALQRGATAAFLVRVPRFVDTLAALAAASAAALAAPPSTAAAAATLPHPAELLALLTGLVAGAADPTGGVAAGVSQVLNGAWVGVLRAVEEEYGCAPRGAAEGPVQGPPRAARAARGLVPSLRLLVAADVGAGALRGLCLCGGGPKGPAATAAAALRLWGARIGAALMPPPLPATTAVTATAAPPSPPSPPTRLSEPDPDPAAPVPEDPTGTCTDIGTDTGVTGAAPGPSPTTGADANADAADAADAAEDREERRAAERDELRRLCKALHALLQGFSTSKVD